MNDSLVEDARQEWVLLLLRGLFLLVFGFFALFWPGMTLGALILGFSLYVAIDGVVNILRGVLAVARMNSFWFLTLILGVLEIIIAIYVFRNPELTLSMFMILIGAVLVARGVLEVIVTFDKETADRTLDLITGILALVAGIAVLVYPTASGIAFLWVLGAYALIAGPIIIALSLGLKSFLDENTKR
jgi:uncharacterized membrane protein HdeD (DUF308 family)